MAFPTIVATRTSVRSTNSTTHPVTLPNGSNTVGRRVVILMGVDDGNARTLSLTGWLPIATAAGDATQINNSNTSSVQGFYRDINGTEGFDGTDDSVTFNSNATTMSSHISFLFEAGTFDSTTAPQWIGSTGTSTSPNPASLDPTWGTEDTLWIAMTSVDLSSSAAITVSAYPYASNNLTASNSSTSGVRVGACTTTSATATVDPGTFTISASEDWVAVTVGIRPFTAPESHSGTVTGSGGGNATPVAAKGARLAHAATGGGNSTVSAAKAAQLVYTATGGGNSTVSAAKGAALAHTATGGGDFTYTTSQSRLLAVLIGTGGGDVTTLGTTGRLIDFTATGGGDAVLDGDGDVLPELHTGSVIGTGGGDSVLAIAKGALALIDESGGGDLSTTSTTGRYIALTETGGGDAVTVGGVFESHAGSLIGSGGGNALLEAYKAAQSVLEASGGGDVAFTSTSSRTYEFTATGGGDSTLVGDSDSYLTPSVMNIGMRLSSPEISVRSLTHSVGQGGGTVIRLGMELDND